jgi:hypothetical protein
LPHPSPSGTYTATFSDAGEDCSHDFNAALDYQE